MIVVERMKGPSVARQRVEIVERKGKGHPDTICDSVMEAVSVSLSAAYLKSFGTVLHHNIDKGLLAAGRADIRFGGGRITKPMELVIGDRASSGLSGRRIPVEHIAKEAAFGWFRRNLRFADPEKHLKCRVVLAPGSEELSDIFSRPGKVRGSNDTSALIGYYPLSPTEQAVLRLEQHLNSPEFKEQFPETGEDIKVMGLRTGDRLDLTVAMPLLSLFIASETAYFSRKKEILRAITRRFGRSRGFRTVSVSLNTLDAPGRGLGGIYLSLLGTSAESADSGQVGRGNRVNGLISVNRPMGTEAAAGKNPVSHVGKIYNVLSHRAAEKIWRTVDGIEEVYVMLLSRIGEPIDRPHAATVRILPCTGADFRDVSRAAATVLERELSTISRFCMQLAAGRYPVC